MARIFTSKKHMIREIPRILLVLTHNLFLCWHEETSSFLLFNGKCGQIINK